MSPEMVVFAGVQYRADQLPPGVTRGDCQSMEEFLGQTPADLVARAEAEQANVLAESEAQAEALAGFAAKRAAEAAESVAKAKAIEAAATAKKPTAKKSTAKKSTAKKSTTKKSRS